MLQILKCWFGKHRWGMGVEEHTRRIKRWKKTRRNHKAPPVIRRRRYQCQCCNHTTEWMSETRADAWEKKHNFGQLGRS